MDQDVINLAKAIRQKESGGNFDAVGDAGTSKGGYQWQPGTWKEHSKKILGNENAEMTPDNQNAVAYGMIKTWKDQGLNPAQIAAKWNSGQSDGWEKKIGVTTINGQKIKYNVPAYVKEVTDTYQKFKAEGAQPLAPTPEPEAPESSALFPAKEGESALSGAAKVVGNLIPSAFNFAKGAIKMLNPVEIAKNIKQIPEEFKALKEETGGSAFGALKATAKELPGTAYESLVPEAARDLIKGDLEGARKNIVEDPFGSIAPFVLAARGGAKMADRAATKGAVADFVKEPYTKKTIPKPVTKYTDAFDTAARKTTEVVTAPFRKTAGAIGEGVSRTTRFGIGQATGLNPETITQITENPSAFKKSNFGKVGDRGTLGQEVQSTLAKKAENLAETGKAYDPIRKSAELIKVDPKFVEKTIKETTGLDINKGNVKTKGSASIREASEVRAIQNLYNIWDSIFKKGQMTTTEYLNFRTDLANLAKFERQIGKSKPLENVAKTVRNRFNTQYRGQIKGLKALDDQFSAQKTELSTLSKGIVDRNGNLTDAAINRIANATGKGKDALLARLEATVPGITKKIKVLKAVEDIQAASGVKVGTYSRTALSVGAGFAGTPIAGLITYILTSPEVAVPLLRKYGLLKNAKVVRAVVNGLREGASIVNNPGEKLSPYFNKDVKDLKVKAGLSIEDVSKKPNAFSPKTKTTKGPVEGVDYGIYWDPKQKVWYASQVGTGKRFGFVNKSRDMVENWINVNSKYVKAGVYKPK